MKKILTLFGALTLASTLPLVAQTTEKTTTTERTNADGSVTRTETTTTTTFTPTARKKVVTYFDRYKAEPYGLPPGWVSKVRVKEMPARWRTDNMTPGFVIPEPQRTYLYAAPSDLVELLPPAPTGVRYYFAGRNVVALDPEYTVVDSIPVPTISYLLSDPKLKIDEDDLEDLKDAREDGDDVKIKIDEDGEVDIDDD